MKLPLQALRAVFSAFIGIRKGQEARQDSKLSFADVVTAAIVLAALLIGLLLLLVHLVTS
ncbi:DUF2970 domain-containing protein [Vogesella sp. LIG4]|uniref:DUF2970 domain-containing protein n=1 Tax=Vogesella sp. LIG4 TaxID=1192162 RepID=UPI00081F86F2|nr:DUF2970 domain-containing protein [Vogesella sp. LIG4]SCK13904.1 Protein of unknown function [Vogesella sp. LIG4]